MQNPGNKNWGLIKEKLEIDEKYLRAGTPYSKQLTVENQEHKISYKTWFFDWKAFRSNEMGKDVDYRVWA